MLPASAKRRRLLAQYPPLNPAGVYKKHSYAMQEEKILVTYRACKRTLRKNYIYNTCSDLVIAEGEGLDDDDDERRRRDGLRELERLRDFRFFEDSSAGDE